MELKLLFAISETAVKTGDFRRHFIISQFAGALRKKGVNCKIIDDLDIYGNSKLNKKYLRWIAKPQKLESIITAGVKQLGRAVFVEAQRRVPVVTGNLKSSIINSLVIKGLHFL